MFNFVKILSKQYIDVREVETTHENLIKSTRGFDEIDTRILANRHEDFGKSSGGF